MLIFTTSYSKSKKNLCFDIIKPSSCTKSIILDNSLGVIAYSAPSLAKKLVEIGLSDRTRGYTAVSAIQSALGFLQSGIIDRENKQEIKKIRKALEQLEGEPSGIVDI